jgi:hypothetical protein
MTAEYLHRPPAGWFVLRVMRTDSKQGKRDWVALMMDKDPKEVRQSLGSSPYRSAWVRIPGKHSNRDDACDVLADLMATRH